MFYTSPDQFREKQIAPGVRIRTCWGDRMLMSFVHFEPNAQVPRHSHPHEQVGTVLKGEFDFTIGAVTKRVKEGDSYVVPPNVEHKVQVLESAAIALDIFAPAREDYK